ncbi:MAG: pinensin family lanthipeptide [Bacteroidota bacterium]
MKQRLKLNKLKVKSFITDLKSEKGQTINEMKGGTSPFIISGMICTLTPTIVESLAQCPSIAPCPETYSYVNCNRRPDGQE